MRFALPLVIKGEHTPRLPSDGPARAEPRPWLPRLEICQLQRSSVQSML